MRKNKIKIIIVSSLITLSVFIFTYLNFIKTNPPPPPETKVEIPSVSQMEKKPLLPEAKYASLTVLGKTYKAEIKDKDTVYDVMRNLQSNTENNFSFKYKEYPSMGIFITEINGVVGSPGKYWIYYVNDVEASVSVSKNIIKEGDIINWKQE